MSNKQTVHVVVFAHDAGKVVGVFSTASKAADYISNHPYNPYIIIQRVIDEED